MQVAFKTLLMEDGRVDDLTVVETLENVVPSLDKKKKELIILDLEDNVTNTIEQIQALHQNYEEIKVVAFCDHFEKPHVKTLLESGLVGVLNKEFKLENIKMVINGVLENGYYVTKELGEILFDATLKNNLKSSENTNDLSERELEILKLKCRDLQNKQIAAKLKIAVRTVAFHVSNIYKKTKCTGNAGLLEYAIKKKIVTPNN